MIAYLMPAEGRLVRWRSSRDGTQPGQHDRRRRGDMTVATGPAMSDDVRGPVVEPSEEAEARLVDLGRTDPELLLQLPHRRTAHPRNGAG